MALNLYRCWDLAEIPVRIGQDADLRFAKKHKLWWNKQTFGFAQSDLWYLQILFTNAPFAEFLGQDLASKQVLVININYLNSYIYIVLLTSYMKFFKVWTPSSSTKFWTIDSRRVTREAPYKVWIISIKCYGPAQKVHLVCKAPRAITKKVRG